MKNQLVLVLDFGGQYNQLIARRVRECGVYCEVIRYTTPLKEIAARKPAGIIFTGGPNSVYDEKSPHISKEIFEMGIPILGICYGCQLMAYTLGGTVTTCTTSEYGKTETIYDKSSALFQNEELPAQAISWMSHTDYISQAPEGFTVTAHTENCPVAAMECPERKLYAVQFHPEVNHTQYGLTMLDGFLKKVCGCTGDWTMGNYAKTAIADIRKKVGDGRVLLALSGGVDSSVCAALLSRAVGKKLTCIFVDHGFLRKNEGDEVEAAFADKDINFIRVNAKAAFMEKLSGVSDPETKRKTIGEEFIRAFERESKKLGTVDFLAQGTIYPDVIESGTGDAAVIKSHHNVGGLPDYVDFKEIIEPLRLLFKDEVRQLGIELGLPENLVWRQRSRDRSGNPHHRRDHRRKAVHPAGCGLDLPGGDRQGRTGPEHPPVLRRSDQHAFRWRYGRRQNLRLYAGTAWRYHHRLHDRRLRTDSVRGAGSHLGTYRQRGKEHQSRGV